MATIKTLKALRPDSKFVERVACEPYDVVTRGEVKDLIKNNDLSLLKVTRSEAELDDAVNPYSSVVYELAKKNFENLKIKKILLEDSKSGFYLYSQTVNNCTQNGLVCLTSIKEYLSDKIKKHEKTREDKEIDRTTHIDTLKANIEPIFLFFNPDLRIKEIFNNIKNANKPIYDFITSDNVEHKLYGIFDDNIILELKNLFNKFDNLYIADGHHRAASAARIYKKYSGVPGYDFCLSVVFSSDELKILPYHRVIKDLNNLSENEFLDKLKKYFFVDIIDVDIINVQPTVPHTISMYLNSSWYILKIKDEFIKNDVIESLDVSILQNYVLDDLLGIKDPRTDKRIDFIGGSHKVSKLKNLVDSKDFKVAFAMYPTTINQLRSVADENKLMPPKSTWFFPKLKSGLFIHQLRSENE